MQGPQHSDMGKTFETPTAEYEGDAIRKRWGHDRRRLMQANFTVGELYEAAFQTVSSPIPIVTLPVTSTVAGCGDSDGGVMADALLALRSEFPILTRSTYLVSNSLGAMPRAVPERLAEYANQWAEWGVRAWAKGWWEMPLAVGDEIAPLLGAAPGEVAMAPTVSMAQAAVLSALDFRGGRDTIVMSALDFPSVRYVMDQLAPKFGARVVVVPSDDGLTIDEGRLCEAIDERTALVAISHVLFRSAYIVDAARVTAHAHRMGAVVALDAYHSVGIVPVDVKAIGADFLTGGVLKWLCGGPGGCFLYASPEASARFAPALTGWQAHARPFGFEGEMDYATGAARWLGGTPVIPALFANIEGPRVIKRAGIYAHGRTFLPRALTDLGLHGDCNGARRRSHSRRSVLRRFHRRGLRLRTTFGNRRRCRCRGRSRSRARAEQSLEQRARVLGFFHLRLFLRRNIQVPRWHALVGGSGVALRVERQGERGEEQCGEKLAHGFGWQWE